MKTVDRLTAHWFFCYWASALVFIVLLLLLGGCTLPSLPSESQNYNPTAPYRWTEPAMWAPNQIVFEQ
jgi:hypothetical protein